MATSIHKLRHANSLTQVDTVSAPIIQTSSYTDANFEDNSDEESDDFSDHDSHYSSDSFDFQELSEQTTAVHPPDITTQLLNFADMINVDIQKFFGRKKGEEDCCDIYEDKWITSRSGREQYYADLIRVAQGDNGDGGNRCKSSSEQRDNRNNFSGKMDKKLGLGPLKELFQFGLRDMIATNSSKMSKHAKRHKAGVIKYQDVKPMNQRSLPNSFWREPGSQTESFDIGTNNSAIQTSQPLDFTALLDSWTGSTSRHDEYSGSSHTSGTSPESV